MREIKHKIGIVISTFYLDVFEVMKKKALSRLDSIQKDCLNSRCILEVPGSVEIPVAVKKLAIQNTYNAIIAMGAVIKGETDHYRYVCHNVSYGCQKIAIENVTPVIFGILTCENKEQVDQRIKGNNSLVNKWVDNAIYMSDLMKE